MQGIVGAAFEGLGVAIGSFVGGAVYKAKGGVFMFRAFGLFAIILCVLHAVVHVVILRVGRKEEGEGKRPGFNVISTCDTDRPIVTGGRGEEQIVLSGGGERGLLSDI